MFSYPALLLALVSVVFGWILKGLFSDDQPVQQVKYSPPTAWLNATLGKLWPILNTDLLLGPIIDLLEDALAVQMPRFVHSVRIVDCQQGLTPFELLSITRLPDGPLIPDQNVLQAEEDDACHGHINYEVDFAYSCATVDAIRMTLNAGVGHTAIGGMEFPINIFLRKVTGKLKMRLLLDPSPPFVRNGEVTLCSMPDIQIEAMPMSSPISFDAMKLPGLRQYVLSSIEATAARFITPQSYSLDLDRLLSGQDGRLQLHTVAVILIKIQSVTDLWKADLTGKCDAYVTVSWSGDSKPLASTRVVPSNLNPVFGEHFIVLVTKDAIKNSESLSLKVYDSDRFSADDSLGSVQMSLNEAATLTEESKFSSKVVSSKLPDTCAQLHWSVQYSAVKANVKELEVPPDPPSSKPPSEADGMFSPLRALPFQWEAERKSRRLATISWLSGERKVEALQAAMPPSEGLFSGILSIEILAGIEVQSRSHSSNSKNRLSPKSKQNTGPAIPTLPEIFATETVSSYVEVLLNDILIYRTRTKPTNSNPYFGASLERFIRNYRTARVSFVLRDSRGRENDPVLGLCSMDLKELFEEESQVTRFFPLNGGVGFGKLRLALLFKPVELKLPKELMGADRCTIQIRSASMTLSAQTSTPSRHLQLTVATDLSRKKTQYVEESRKSTNELQYIWQANSTEPSSQLSTIRIPVGRRYNSFLVLEVRTRVMMKGSVWAKAVIPMDTIQDNKRYTSLTVPLVPAQDEDLILQSTDGSASSNVLGHVTLDVLFDPGIGPEHRGSFGLEIVKAYETYLTELDLKQRDDYHSAISSSGSSGGSDSDSSDTSVSKQKAQVSPSDEKSIRSPRFRHSQSQSVSDKSRSFGRKQLGLNEDEALSEDEWSRNAKETSHSKQLHRQHKGIMQLKPVRTAIWMTGGAKRKLKRLTSLGSPKESQQTEVEREGISSL